MSETNVTNVDVTENEVAETEEKNGKFYTEEDIALIEQKAGDKRISLYQKTMEKKQREAEKLRGMNAEEQREYNLNQREQALAQKESELAMLENKSEGLSILAQKGLDAKLIDFVLDADGEQMYENIKLLEKCFKNSVRAEVEKRLASKTPAKTFDLAMTKAQFGKMSLKEMQELHDTNPELYASLTK